MAVLEIQANGDTAVSKEAIVNAGQSLEDPLMRVSVKNTSRPKYTAATKETQRRRRTVLLYFINTCLHMPVCFLFYFKPCSGNV